MLTATTMTLDAFLAGHSICRLWWAGVGAPAGVEFVLNADEDADEEDYCDCDQLRELIPEGAGELEGQATQDPDGEFRWEVGSLEDADLRDDRGNTIYNLKVWAN